MSEAGPPGWRRRLAWLVACGLTFVTVYGACGAWTARRTGVGTWYHRLELEIPFLPWMIFPYWSSDLLFVGAFLLAPDRARLDTLGARVVAAILGAGVGFLLVPLALAFPRPEVSGAPGTLFDLLRAFDGPHNLFPSLHVALCVVWADVYLLRAGQWAGAVGRALVAGWLALVVLSTLFTWQHQVVDLAGGAALGLLCVHSFRAESTAVVAEPSPRIGRRYAAGAVLAAGAALAAWPVTAWLLWPAAALAISAAGYLGRGPSIYRKRNGRVPFSTRCVMAPCRLGQSLSLAWYRRRCHAWDPVTSLVWIGRVLAPREAEAALRAGVRAVLDLTAEFDEAEPFLARANYRNVPLLDLTAPGPEQMRAAVGFVEQHAAAGEVVYVHCKIGYSRSAAVVGAWLIARGLAADVDAAIATLRAVRPTLIVRRETKDAIAAFVRSRDALPTPCPD